MAIPSSAPPRTIRLSFAGVVLLTAVIVLLGGFGGAVASRWLWPPLPPLTDDAGTVIPPVQEVTISPNTSAARVVASIQPSVFLISPPGATPEAVIATGFLVTNDGLGVTTASLPAGPYVALTDTGAPVALSVVARDALFGLTFVRLTDVVTVPLDVGRAPAAVGQTLLAVSRHTRSWQPTAAAWLITEYALPSDTDPAGIQRLMRALFGIKSTWQGAPLVDEEGRVVGVVKGADATTALPVESLRVSLDRVVGTKWESDPVRDVGLTLRYVLARPAQDAAPAFAVNVVAVAPGSLAAQAGVRAGDQLVRVGEAAVQWETSVVAALAQPKPLALTVRRQGAEPTLTVGGP